MNVDRLKALVPALPDLEARCAMWQSDNPDGDTADFLVDLHRNGVLTVAQVADAVGRLDVEFVPRQSATDHELCELGRGSMGTVSLVRDAVLNRHVARKRLTPGYEDNATLMRRFQQEAQIMAQLDHPNIAPVYRMERGRRGEIGYSMKLVRGRTLRDYLNEAKAQYENGQPDEEHALPARLDIFLQMCAAVHHAHSRSVIHRDLKPSNIMIGPFGEVLVMDWGIARLLGRSDEIARTKPVEDDGTGTQMGQVLGTPAYMSPEQAGGKNDDLDARSDQYALGLMLFEIVALKRAISGKNATDTITRARAGAKDPFIHIVRTQRIPRPLQAIVDRATARDPNGRYADVDAFADDVRRYVRDEPIMALPDSPMERAARLVAHHREAALFGLFGLILALLAVAAAGIGGGFVMLETHRYNAAKRERALGEVVTAVSEQAHTIDARFLRFEGLLTGVTFAANRALGDSTSRAEVIHTTDVASRPDAIETPVYRERILPEKPTIWTVPGTKSASEAKLASLGPELRTALFGSAADNLLTKSAEERLERLTKQGMSVAWVYVATDDGAMVILPGASVFPSDYDPRTQAWYLAALGRDKVTWGEAGRDPSDSPEIGLMIPCTHGLFVDGKPRGVAALDVSLHHVIDGMMRPSGISMPLDTWLLDGKGNTLITSIARDADTDQPPFPHRELLLTASGHAESEGALIVWAPLQALGWTYVVVGSTSELLESQQ